MGRIMAVNTNNDAISINLMSNNDNAGYSTPKNKANDNKLMMLTQMKINRDIS